MVRLFVGQSNHRLLVRAHNRAMEKALAMVLVVSSLEAPEELRGFIQDWLAWCQDNVTAWFNHALFLRLDASVCHPRFSDN